MSLNKSTLPGLFPSSKTRLQLTDVALDDDDLTITISQLSSCLISQTPTQERTLTLPSAAVLLDSTALFPWLDVADGIPFTLRNLADAGSGFDITVTVGTGGTADTNATLIALAGTQIAYLIRMDDVAAGSESYTLFTMAQSSSGPLTGGSAYAFGTVQNTSGTSTAINHTTWTALETGAPSVSLSVGVTLATTFDVPSFTVGSTGVYAVSVNLSLSYTTTEMVLIGVGIDGSSPTDSLTLGKSNTANDVFCVSGVQVASLTAGQSVSVYALSTLADSALSVYNYNVAVTRVQ